jgi:PAS domain S-box-containing protein
VALCAGGAAVGVVGLIGWISGTPWLTTFIPGLPPMMPNTALALLLIGAAGVVGHRDDGGGVRFALSRLAALAVLTMAVGTLVEYALAIDLPILRIGQALVHSPLAASAGPSSPYTAVTLAFLATAILVLHDRPGVRAHAAELLALGAATTAFTGLTGILLGAAPLYRLTLTPVIGLSLPAALSLLSIAIGLLMRPAPHGVVMRLARSPGPGGSLIRRWMLPITVVPILLGLVVTRIAAAQGIADIAVPVALLVAMMAVVSLSLLLVMARPLNRVHDAMQASRAQIRNLVEHASDGIFVADLAGRYTDVNDAGCRLLGYSREEIVGKTIVDLIPPGDVDRLWRSRASLLEGAVEVSEWILRRKDGSYVPVEVSAKILSDGRWQGFVRDISERKRLQREAEISEAKSTGILSISADAIISSDDAQRITQFNDGAQKIFGYSKAEVMGAPLDVLIPERFRSVHRAHIAGFVAGTSVARRMGEADLGVVGRRKNGEEFPADAAISKLQVGGTWVLTVVLRDVTEQKRLENEQRLLAEMGAALAATLDYGEIASRLVDVVVQRFADCCAVDLTSGIGDEGRPSMVSAAGSRIPVGDGLHGNPCERQCPALIQSVLESRQPLVVPRPSRDDLEALGRDRNDLRAFRPIDVQALMIVPLIAGERVLGAICFLWTASSPVEQQATLQMARAIADRAAVAVDKARLYQEARRATQVRDEVLGIVAHDLRNPLSTILTEAWLLGEREAGQQIQRAAERMNRLIQDLLDVTRLEAGRLTLRLRPLRPAQVAADAVQIQSGLAAAGAHELRLELSTDLLEVDADRDRLLQVFENLIGNAIKFTPAGGSITVGAVQEGMQVLFSVRDNGPGIAPEDQPHLFDRFWQARPTRRDGAGLGLPIVKGIVEAHGGRVWVQSAPETGSTFFFTIPGSADRRAPPSEDNDAGR